MKLHSKKKNPILVTLAVVVLVAGTAFAQKAPVKGDALGAPLDFGVPGVDIVASATGTGVNQYIGVAATPNLVVYTRPFCQVGVTVASNPPGTSSNPREIRQILSTGGGATANFGFIPDIAFDGTISTCFENYISISPGGGAWASMAGQVFVATAHTDATGHITDTTAVDIWRFPSTGGAGTLFTTVGGVYPQGTSKLGGHSGLGFDNQGNWNFNLLLGGAGGVWEINPAGVATLIAGNPLGSPVSGTENVVFESLRVAPPGYPGGFAGWIFAQSDDVSSATSNGVYAFGPPGCTPGSTCTAVNVVTGTQAPAGESVNFVPGQLCTFTINGVGYPYFLTLYDHNTPTTITSPDESDVIGVRLGAFTAPSNSMLIQDEDNGTVGVYSSTSGSPPASTFLGNLFALSSGSPASPPDQEDSTIIACPAQVGCPATQGFWHFACRWPTVTALVDGVQYNGGTDLSMTIGGINYSQTELLQVMPSGALHSGNYANTISQLIAAVLNISANGQHTAPVDAAISGLNSLFNATPIFCNGGTSLCSYSKGFQNSVTNFLNTLNNYNSAVGLGCSEGNGLATGACH